MRDRKIIEDQKSYESLFQTCLDLDSKYNEATYHSYSKNITGFSKEVSNKIDEFKTEVSQVPLTAFIILWIDNFHTERPLDSIDMDMMRDLIEKKFISYKIPKKNKLVNLQEFVQLTKSNFGHSSTIDLIRCYKSWSFEKREVYISFYLDFIKWLSKVTFGYVPEALDVDRVLTHGRLLKFETYVKIVNNLFLRERILAKIFYLGGSRTLEEVFSLKIEDINFAKSTLKLSGTNETYPKHVLQDLQEYIGLRKSGFVFISREGNQIDPTVPYRALKVVTNKMDVDKSFTFMDFMKSA